MEKFSELTIVALYDIYFSKTRQQYLQFIKPHICRITNPNDAKKAFEMLPPKWPHFNPMKLLSEIDAELMLLQNEHNDLKLKRERRLLNQLVYPSEEMK